MKKATLNDSALLGRKNGKNRHSNAHRKRLLMSTTRSITASTRSLQRSPWTRKGSSLSPSGAQPPVPRPQFHLSTSSCFSGVSAQSSLLRRGHRWNTGWSVCQLKTRSNAQSVHFPLHTHWSHHSARFGPTREHCLSSTRKASRSGTWETWTATLRRAECRCSARL